MNEHNRRPEHRWSIRALRGFNLLFTRAYHRTVVRGPWRVPWEGPGILVANHVSGLDPALLQSASPRLITWMMAKEYYDQPAMNWLFRTVGAIPVARSGRDMAAMRAAMRVLEQGGLLGVFPEGRIEPGEELLPFQTGVALMAIRSGAPVYPAYITGTHRGKEMVEAYLVPQDTRVTFGEAVEIPREGTSRETLEEATRRMEGAVRELQARTGFRVGG